MTLIKFYRWKILALTLAFDENGDNHAVHTEHTSHDDGDDRSEEKVWLEDGDGDNTNTRFSSTIGSAEVSENEGRDDTHSSEENSLVRITKSYKKKMVKLIIWKLNIHAYNAISKGSYATNSAS